MRRTILSVCTLAAFFLAPLAWGHYTWLARTHYSPSGDIAYLEIGHGHDFPVSEEAPSTTHLQAFLVNDGGERKPLRITKEGTALKLEAPLAGRELARVYYVRDRGVISQTADGWKDGGRDQHPGAKSSIKTTQYGIAWVGFQGTTNNAKPLGLELELNYEKGIRGRLVRVMRSGKPARGVDVLAVMGEDSEVALGKTDAQGYVSADKLPVDKAMLFSVRQELPAAKGAQYDKTVLGCTLSIPGE
ncbi:MAG: DUF4198 domain-containing protein [Bryobacterales bacterium]|nr:DUF4198 domain-containing protein [Bryobacterales bacterium]